MKKTIITMMACLGIVSLQATTFVVTSRNDSGPGTLRQAILDSNATLLSTPNVITFDLPTTVGPQPFVIFVSTPLPTITRPVQILGNTQPGSLSTQPIIDLTSFSLAAPGLTINTTNCTVRRLAIYNFQQEGILLQSGGGHLIVGNHLGINTNGNIFGVGNGFMGISVAGSHFNIIGGTNPQDRNVISENGAAGIFISQSSLSNTVRGNFVGTDMSGMIARGNHDNGIVIQGHYNVIGGDILGAGNLVSGNLGNPFGSAGIFVDGPFGARAIGNWIQGNLVGTDVTGTIAMGNQNGIILETSEHTLVGGITEHARNIVSGNVREGILSAVYPLASVGAKDTTIQGNFIGTDKLGNSPLGNGRAGINMYILANANIMIGGTNNPGEANRVAYNGQFGVGVTEGNQCAILGNSIFLNGSTTNIHLGIDLNFDNLTLNDLGDPDFGPNLSQNFPILTLAASDGINITISGTLNSEPNREYRLQFFRNSACDPSGYGEGQNYIGQQIVTTDAGGNVSFTATLPSTSFGNVITATATSTENNTSEFSACILLSLRPLMSISLSGSSVTIAWPVSSGASWILQSSPILDKPDWDDVGVSPVLIGDVYEVKVAISSENHFYRLRTP